MAELFLAEATRLARDVAGGALRSRGQATWLADEIALVDGQWMRTTGTLGPDLASGTAGVGWFLARCAAVVGDHELADVAGAAVRHGLERAGTLMDAGRFDWYHGASGVAWAAFDAGRALGSAELLERGARTAQDVVRAAGNTDVQSGALSLVGGAAGVVAGLLALARAGADPVSRDVAAERAAELAATVSDSPAELGAGFARGWSGVGLVLAQAAAVDSRVGCVEAARQAFTLERAQFEPGRGWHAPTAHDWAAASAAPDATWCRGAAGIGLARLGARRAMPDLFFVAEAGAAVDLVRRHLAAPGGRDASLCHGDAGAIELLLSAGLLLREEAHVGAARAAGLALVERASSAGRYEVAFGAPTRNPSLLFGLAGVGTLLLRLDEPGALPTPTLPPA